MHVEVWKPLVRRHIFRQWSRRGRWFSMEWTMWADTRSSCGRAPICSAILQLRLLLRAILSLGVVAHSGMSARLPLFQKQPTVNNGLIRRCKCKKPVLFPQNRKIWWYNPCSRALRGSDEHISLPGFIPCPILLPSLHCRFSREHSLKKNPGTRIPILGCFWGTQPKTACTV